MALDINGYNSAFKSFVDFAQNRIGENQEKAIADARIKKFNGEEVLTIAHAKTDEVHKWLRTGDECDVNDRTRAIFRAAVVNMFGGENRVPERASPLPPAAYSPSRPQSTRTAPPRRVPRRSGSRRSTIPRTRRRCSRRAT